MLFSQQQVSQRRGLYLQTAENIDSTLGKVKPNGRPKVNARREIFLLASPQLNGTSTSSDGSDILLSLCRPPTFFYRWKLVF